MSSDEIIRNIVKRQRGFDEATLKKIAARLNSIRGLGLVDLFDLGYFALMYSEMMKIDAMADMARKRNVQDLSTLLNESAKSAYNGMKTLYLDGQREFLPYKSNQEVKDFVNTTSTSLCKDFNDKLGKIGYQMTDANGKRIFNSPSETYQHIVNTAKNQKTVNAFGYDLWARNTMKKLLRNGLKIYNYNQDTHRYKQQNCYSYIRNFVKNAVYQVCQGVYNTVANQVGIDGVEISVHADCAIDHLDVQGHQFTLMDFHKMQSGEDFYDVLGNHYYSLERAIGTWNCRHFVYPIILGKSEPRYTNEQLQKIKENKNMIYAKVTNSLGETDYVPFSEFNLYKRELQNRIDSLTVDMNVAEKLKDKWLEEYYKTRLSKCKLELASIKRINIG